MIKQILVPLDNSDLSIRVLDVAFSVAGKFDADVRLLRINKERASLERGQSELDMRIVEQEADALLGAAVGRLRGEHGLAAENVQVEVRSGPVFQTIADAANEHQSDLVIMGTHGRHGFTEMFTGSTTEQIVARIPTSVMVIKPEGFPYLRD